MLCENRAMPESVTVPPGISEKEALERLERYGENALLEKKKRCAFLKKVLLSFADVMTLVLFAAAAVSFAVAKLKGESAADSYMILAIVFLNGIVTAFQETRAEKALEALKTLTSPECTAVREGKEKRIPAKFLVPGDVILVKKGDSVPADAVILQSVSLRADESALTGESGGVEKSAHALPDAKAHATPPDMIFAGTVITSGSAAARVTGTGMRTRMGKIAEMLISEPVPRTPMQVRLAKISAKLGNAALGICFVIFLLSLYKGVPPEQAFLNSVSLAVAAIPEGLPAVVTVMLSVGVTEMAKRRAVVKKLTAVEALGCATVICSDKTGTLTQNRLEVTSTKGEKRLLARLFALCNRNSSPTENALFEFAVKTLGEHAVRSLPPIVREVPFEHETRVMATLHREKSGGYTAVVKGAPEEVFRLCGVSARADERFAAKGLRVVACGCAKLQTPPEDLLKIRYTYAGCAGMTDPPRPEAFEAVRVCRSAGIKTVMITGDHPDTAFAVAQKLGIASTPGEVATQAQIESLPESEQENAILGARVFARSAPEFKVKIIRAYKNAGEICAMTGDGVNDAPALKSAHIGCAMGKNGTDVAREACDMILTDDNFKTIEQAVLTGRGIYENVRRAVHFLISCNIGEILSVFAALMLSLPAPVTAVQLLWVNLVTDSLPAIALGLEKPRAYLMERPPVRPDSPLFGKAEKLLIVLEGAAVGALTLLAYAAGGSGAGSTMAFGVLSFSQLFHSFNVRSDRPLLCSGVNLPLALAFALSGAMQLAAMIFPPLMRVFSTVALTPFQWVCTAALSACVLVAGEFAKLISYAAQKRAKKVAKAGDI